MKVFLFCTVICVLLVFSSMAQTPASQEPEKTTEAVKSETTGDVEKAEGTAEPEAAAETEDPSGTLRIKEMSFCTDVEEREPVSRSSSFTSDAGKIFFWTNILNDGDETDVEHVWLYNGEEMARISLPAKFARNRVWSSKTILPEWKGEWKVVVLAGSEKLGESICQVE